MIWVKASQVSYDNEIAELVKVFLSREQVAALSRNGLGVEDGKIHADCLWRIWYWKQDTQGTFRFPCLFAFMQGAGPFCVSINRLYRFKA